MLIPLYAPVLLLYASFVAARQITPFIEQSFFFQWNPSTAPLPIPTTAQCETLHISWSRSTALGPNPVAPYYLQIYTSTFSTPFIVYAGMALEYFLPIPFNPGTRYQICMFDSNGATGGCQDTYTVYPNTTASGGSPSCANLTVPENSLGVEGTVDNGPISRYGWIDQCTDVSLRPTNGTPPYTMTVAPALHPPYNITSDSQDSINWTVSLSWGAPFFLSLVDSTGLTWSTGPQHSGGGGPTDCLDLSLDSPSQISTSAIVGSGVGGLVGGVIIGMLVAGFFTHRKYRRVRRENSAASSLDGAPYAHDNSNFKLGSPVAQAGPSTTPGHHPSFGSGQYLIEPFTPDAQVPSPLRRETQQPQEPRSPSQSSVSQRPSEPSGSGSGAGGPSAQQRVYVVHHDGGGPPVTVYTGGADVVELPPSYVGRPENSENAPGGSVQQVQQQQQQQPESEPFEPQPRRRPGPLGRKPRGPSDAGTSSQPNTSQPDTPNSS